MQASSSQRWRLCFRRGREGDVLQYNCYGETRDGYYERYKDVMGDAFENDVDGELEKL